MSPATTLMALRLCCWRRGCGAQVTRDHALRDFEYREGCPFSRQFGSGYPGGTPPPPPLPPSPTVAAPHRTHAQRSIATGLASSQTPVSADSRQVEAGLLAVIDRTMLQYLWTMRMCVSGRPVRTQETDAPVAPNRCSGRTNRTADGSAAGRADPVTKAWMKETLQPLFGFPDLTRFSWQPAARALEEGGPAVQWCAPARHPSWRLPPCPRTALPCVDAALLLLLRLVGH